jgi:methyltransferase (TIGR00027 family)
MKASHTAVLVCQGRAVADGRFTPDRFADPTAITLLREEERAEVQRVREGKPPKDLASRMTYELIRGGAEIIVPRTVAIDEAILEHAAPQVVILGAGLDGRAWRMPALAGAYVCEVDQPASQHEKQDRAAALPADRAPRFVPVDFGRDRLADALAAAGHRTGTPTTWVWEGVVPYLTRAAVAATVAEVAACSAPGSRLIVNYQSPSRFGGLVRRVIGALARRANPWAAEPWRSAWTADAMAALLSGHGFTVRRDADLLATASAIGSPHSQAVSLRNGRVAVADR